MAIDGVEVLVIEIPAGRPVTSTSDGVYRRRGTDAHGRPVCVPFLVHEIQGREATRGALDYTALVVPEARWEDLDPLEIERVRRTIALNRGRADSALLDLSDAEIVRALGLGEGGKERGDRVERVRVAALLMVGREECDQALRAESRGRIPGAPWDPYRRERVRPVAARCERRRRSGSGSTRGTRG